MAEENFRVRKGITVDGTGDSSIAGNLGIGTTSPQTPLHVVGNVMITNTDSDDTVKDSRILGRTYTNNDYNLIYGYADSTTNRLYLGGGTGTGEPATDIRFFTAALNADTDASGTEAMRITSAGNVGIGVTPAVYSSGATTLQVHDATIAELRLTTDQTGSATNNGSLIQAARAESTDNLYIWNKEAGKTIFATSGVERARIDASGNVGIGTTSPASLLHVGSTAYELSSGAFLTGSHQRTAKMVIHADDANTDWDEQEIGLALHNEDPTNNNWSPHIAFTTHEDDDGTPANANPVAVAAISATYNTRVANGWAKGDLVFFTNNAGSGNAERLRITGAGNVGIGTTSPGSALDVSGTITATAADIGDIQIRSNNEIENDSSSIFLQYNTGNDVEVGSTGTNADLVVVGRIGVSPHVRMNSPSRTLHLKNDANATDNVYMRMSAGNEGISGIEFGDTDDGDVGKILYDHDGSIGMRFISGASERMRIKTDGKVGIGTTSPYVNLEIVGGSQYTNTYKSHLSIVDTETAYNGSNPGGAVIFGGIDDSSSGWSWWAKIAGEKANTTDGNRSGILNFYTRKEGGNPTSQMVIDEDGHVGIGTSSPGSTLHLTSGSGYLKFETSGSVGSIKSDFNLDLYADDGGNNSASYQNIRFFTDGTNERMRIASDGKVGIGTTSPGALLHVSGSQQIWDGTNEAHLILRRNATGTNYGSSVRFEFGDSGSASSGHLYARLVGAIQDSTDGSEDGYLRFDTSGGAGAITERMRITHQGNVGIGTTSPATKLHVNGNMLLGSTFDKPTGSTFDAADAQLILGGAFNAEFNTGTDKAHLLISSHDNDDGTALYPIFVQDENVGNNSGADAITGADFFIKNRQSSSGDSTAYFGGKVGIGTISPSFASGSGLHIFNSTQANLRLEDAAGEYFDVAMQNGDAYLINRVSDGFMSFRTNGTERIRIASDGDVGIGTTSPLTTLHVHADSINDGAVTISQADNSGDASQLDLSKARGSGASPTAVQNSDFIGQVRMLGYDGDSYDNFADIYVQASNTISTTSHPTKMVIRTTRENATSPTTALTIDETQNVKAEGNLEANEALIIRNDVTPSSASDFGMKGEIRWDSNYIYICVENDTWKRVALSTW